MVIIFTFVWALDMDCKVMFVRAITRHTVTSRWPLMIPGSWNARCREYFRLEERTPKQETQRAMNMHPTPKLLLSKG